jgi:hypothetical protein
MQRPRPSPQAELAGPPYLIGWKELVDFPDWGISQVKAKVDTGARTSAIHVEHYQLYEDARLGLMAELCLALNRRKPEHMTIVHTPVLKTVLVRNSGGQSENRPLIATRIRLGPIVKPILLTATNRATMLFRMLLGRKALEGDFLVDVRQRYRLRGRSGEPLCG